MTKNITLQKVDNAYLKLWQKSNIIFSIYCICQAQPLNHDNQSIVRKILNKCMDFFFKWTRVYNMLYALQEMKKKTSWLLKY